MAGKYIRATRTRNIAGLVNNALGGVSCKIFTALKGAYMGKKDSNMAKIYV